MQDVFQFLLEQIKTAMKAKNQIRLECVRNLKSDLKLLEIDKGIKVGEEELKACALKLVKSRKESAEIYRQAGRLEECAKEEAEAKVLEEFAPKQLSEAEMIQHIESAIKEIGANGMKDLGKVMPVVMKKIGGQGDGKWISSMVKEKLAGP